MNNITLMVMTFVIVSVGFFNVPALAVDRSSSHYTDCYDNAGTFVSTSTLCTDVNDNDWSTGARTQGSNAGHYGHFYQNWTISDSDSLNRSMQLIMGSGGGNGDVFISPYCWNGTDMNFLNQYNLIDGDGGVAFQINANPTDNNVYVWAYYLYQAEVNMTFFLPNNCLQNNILTMAFYVENWNGFAEIYDLKDITYNQYVAPTTPPTYSSVSATPGSPSYDNTTITFNAVWNGAEEAWLNYDGVNYSMTNSTLTDWSLSFNGTAGYYPYYSIARNSNGYNTSGTEYYHFLATPVYISPLAVLANRSCYDMHTTALLTTMNISGNITGMTIYTFCDNGCNSATGNCSSPDWFGALIFGSVILILFGLVMFARGR